MGEIDKHTRFKKTMMSPVLLLDVTYKNVLFQICKHVYPFFENSIQFELFSKVSGFTGIRCTIYRYVQAPELILIRS